MSAAGRLAFYPGRDLLIWNDDPPLTLDPAESAILTLMSARPGRWFLWSEIARHAVQYGWPAEHCAGIVEHMRRLAVALLGTTARIEADSKHEMFRFVGVIAVG